MDRGSANERKEDEPDDLRDRLLLMVNVVLSDADIDLGCCHRCVIGLKIKGKLHKPAQGLPVD